MFSRRSSRLTPQAVKYLVLTHNHADHAAGAAMFASEGAQVLITTADRENMAKVAKSRVATAMDLCR